MIPLIRKTKVTDRLSKVNYELTNQLKQLTEANSELTDEMKLLKSRIVSLQRKKIRKPIFKIPPPEIFYEDDYWVALTNWYRQLNKWTCECCHLDLKEHPYFLDTHHIFGRRHNEPKFLKALCIGCHAEQTEPYNHMFMKKTSRSIRFRDTYADWKCYKCNIL